MALRYAQLRQEWINGTRSPMTHTIAEWECLGKPNKKNTKINK